MSSPDWNMLSEKYLLPRILKKDKNQVLLFGVNGSTELHNEAFHLLKEAGKRGDLTKYGIVKYAYKMLPAVQTSLLKQGKVVSYKRNGKTIYRNNIRWTPQEIQQLRNLRSEGKTFKQIAGVLGRGENSVYQKYNNTR